MSSRVEQKAVARRQRLAFEAEQRSTAARRRSLRRLSLVAAAALVLTAAAIVTSRLTAQDAPVAATPATVSARFADLEQRGISLGSPAAPATLIEFADLQCPFCGDYARDVLPSVLDRYVRSGRLRLQLHVLTFVGEDSVKAGTMAAAATRQNRLWSFADAFYAAQGQENTGYVTDEFLDEVGTAGGVDLQAARAAQTDAATTEVLTDAQAAADRLGAQSTPTFFLQRGSGEPQALDVSELTPEAFAATLDEALAAR